MERNADQSTGRWYTPLLASAAVLLILLPLLYVFSIGPMVWFVTSGRLPVGPNSLVVKIYAPLEMLCERSPTVGKVIYGYAELWRADRPVPPPPSWQSAPPTSPSSPQPAPATPAPSDSPDPQPE
jgi:hypothetical protein